MLRTARRALVANSRRSRRKHRARNTRSALWASLKRSSRASLATAFVRHVLLGNFRTRVLLRAVRHVGRATAVRATSAAVRLRACARFAFLATLSMRRQTSASRAQQTHTRMRPTPAVANHVLGAAAGRASAVVALRRDSVPRARPENSQTTAPRHRSVWIVPLASFPTSRNPLFAVRAPQASSRSALGSPSAKHAARVSSVTGDQARRAQLQIATRVRSRSAAFVQLATSALRQRWCLAHVARCRTVWESA